MKRTQLCTPTKSNLPAPGVILNVIDINYDASNTKWTAIWKQMFKILNNLRWLLTRHFVANHFDYFTSLDEHCVFYIHHWSFKVFATMDEILLYYCAPLSISMDKIICNWVCTTAGCRHNQNNNETFWH